MPGWELSYMEDGTVGLHLIINPQPRPSTATRVRRRFLQQGLRLNSKELDTIMTGYGGAVSTINRVIQTAVPGLKPKSQMLSTRIADYILDESLEVHLANEAPSALQRLTALDEKFSTITGQQIPGTGSLQESLKGLAKTGVSLTIHFDPDLALIDWVRGK